MTIRLASIDSLMLSDAGIIESDLSQIHDKDWQALIPSGRSLSNVKQELALGNSVILNEATSSPLYGLVNGTVIASNTRGTDINEETLARINQRFNSGTTSAEFKSTLGDSLPPSPPLEYTPDTSKVNEASSESVAISCQYNIEIACSPKRLSSLDYGYFMLEKTENETSLASWRVSQSGSHTLLTVQGKFNEAKRLSHIPMTGLSSGLSVNNVNMVPLGSLQVTESFIPVQLAVQVGERLGYPTKGYFYHFKQGELLHEYKIIEDTKGSFCITNSTADKLVDSIRFSTLRNHIYLPWKISGRLLTSQHLYFSEKKLTLETFCLIDESWLDENAFCIDLKQVLTVNQSPILDRTSPKNTDDNAQESTDADSKQTMPPAKPQAVTRPENVFYKHKQPEIFPFVTGINQRIIMPELAVVNVIKLDDINTKTFPDKPLRKMLKDNNQHIMFLTPQEAMKVLLDWGWKDTKTLWQTTTDSELGQVLINYGVNGKDVVTTSMLITQLGNVGIKATSYINKSGTEMIKLSGYAGIRKVLNAPSFSAANPKIVQVGIGKFGLANSIKSGAVLTFYVAAAYRTVDYILTDEQRLSEFIGSMATDVVKIGITAAIAWGAGTLVATSLVVAGFAIVIVVGLLSSIALNVLDEHYGITDKVIEYLEKSQQNVVERAREIEDGIWDLGAMVFDGMLEAGKFVIEQEIKRYIRRAIKELSPNVIK